MQVWVDADACPVPIREIICRAANRTQVKMNFVSNQPIRLPRSAYIRMIVVEKGFDKADHEIVARVSPSELVITQDIPLAAEVLALGVQALSPRGSWYSMDDIKARLTMRDFMDTLRGSGIHSGGPSAMGDREKQTFANALDTWLTQLKN